MATLLDSLDGRRDVPQIEFIAGDAVVALTVRHLQPLSEADRLALIEFGKEHGIAIFLQSGGVESVRLLWPDEVLLAFRLKPWDVEFVFRPLDFIQINGG